MIKENIKNFIKKLIDWDDLTSSYDDSVSGELDAKIAKHNYQLYQEDLKQRQQNCIKKWSEKISEVSRNGAQYFDTNCFVVDPVDKNKIRWIIDDNGCVGAYPSSATLDYFKQYFENKGFDVAIMEWPHNQSSLRISWAD